MRNKLTVLGSDPPVEHELAAFNSLGRASTNSIVLADPTVAEEHAHIVHVSTGFTLCTLWKGELRVDGELVDYQRQLADGDEITLGRTTLVVHLHDDTPRSLAAIHFRAHTSLDSPPHEPPSMWVVPRGDECVLIHRPAGAPFRGGPPRLVELGPVAMPLHATHVVDPAGDLLAYAHLGAVTIVRGLRIGPRTSQRIQLPPWARIYSLHLLDGVVYVGATGSASMLGFIDTRGEPRWQRIEVPRHHIAPQKGVDGFARRGPCLIAVDDVVMPRYFLFLDVSDPRSPRLVEVRDLDGYIRDERVVGVAGNGTVMAVLSGSNASQAAWIELLTLPTLTKLGSLSPWWRSRDPALPPSRSTLWYAVAMAGDSLFIAAGEDGVGVLRVPTAPREDLGPELRFVPVAAGPVIDVAAVDDEHVFAIVPRRRRAWAFWKTGADAVLIPTSA